MEAVPLASERSTNLAPPFITRFALALAKLTVPLILHSPFRVTSPEAIGFVRVRFNRVALFERVWAVGPFRLIKPEPKMTPPPVMEPQTERLELEVMSMVAPV